MMYTNQKQTIHTMTKVMEIPPINLKWFNIIL